MQLPIHTMVNVIIERGIGMRKLSKEEKMLQEIFGYTDEQLLEEVRLAEEELEQMGGIEPVTAEEIIYMRKKMTVP